MSTYRQLAIPCAAAAMVVAILAASGAFKPPAQNSAAGPGAASGNTAAIDPVAEAARRKSVLNDLIMDYIRSHPDAPVGWSKILIAAEPYINEGLAKRNEPFRFDAGNEHFVDRK